MYLFFVRHFNDIDHLTPVAWKLHNEDELKNALVSLQAPKADVPYSQKSVAAFLSEVVYGGDSNRDVLDAYEHFIVNCALSKRPTLA